MTSVVAIWSWLGLWLVLAWAIFHALRLAPRLRTRHRLNCLAALLLAGVVTQIHWFGYPLNFWSASLAANFSVTLILLLSIWVAEQLTGRKYLRAAEWRTAWLFGAAASVLLYPSALGLGPGSFDAYSLGWPWLDATSALLFGSVAVFAAILFLRGNRFAIVLLVATAAYPLQFQESLNYWDYVLDPVYGAASIVGVVCLLASRFLRGRPE